VTGFRGVAEGGERGRSSHNRKRLHYKKEEESEETNISASPHEKERNEQTKESIGERRDGV